MNAVTLTPNLGELCPGQDVVLTCSTTDGVSMNWVYNGMSLDPAGFLPSDPINTTRDVMVSGFMFSLELTSSMPEFASTLSFRADAAMNGHSALCRVAIPLSGGGFDIQEITQTLQIAQIALVLGVVLALTSLIAFIITDAGCIGLLHKRPLLRKEYLLTIHT